MAKKRQGETMDPIEALEHDEPKAAVSFPVAVTIELPIGDLVPGQYISNHVQVGHLSADHGRALRRLTLGLSSADARLENGKPIVAHADAVRWLLEEIAKKIR